MTSPEDDGETAALLQRPLVADTTHFFRDRLVLQVSGDLKSLEDIAVCPPPSMRAGAYFVCLLNDAGHIDTEFFVIPHAGEHLIDVHRELADDVATRLDALEGVERVEVFAQAKWRVLGELPNQIPAESRLETIRFADQRRRELGNRVLREASEPEGLDWRHSRKWDTHAMKLGVLPDHRCVRGLGITPEEAGFHKLGGGMWPQERWSRPIRRRVLPVRIEPRDQYLPPMTGLSLMAGDEKVGVMLDHEGLYGIALIEIAPWRAAIDRTIPTTCADEPVLITWPTWLSSESEGRCGPAGDLI